MDKVKNSRRLLAPKSAQLLLTAARLSHLLLRVVLATVVLMVAYDMLQGRLDGKGSQSGATAPSTQTGVTICPPLTKELISQYAKDNTIMITATDQHMLKRFAHSWLASVHKAGISYYLIAALDEYSNVALPPIGATQCFSATVDMPESGDASKADSLIRHRLQWKKVHIIKAVYDMGFNVMSVDIDTTWWRDPLPWLQTQVSQWPVDMLFSTDDTSTFNSPGDFGLEMATTAQHVINPGVYYITQHAGGSEYLTNILDMEPKQGVKEKDRITDMDAHNTVIRGFYMRGPGSPKASWNKTQRVIYAASHNTTRVGVMPVHLIANSYTYSIGRVHERFDTTPYATHWVFTGSTPECKVAHMRDAMTYVDAPTWYGLPPSPREGLYQYIRHKPHEPLMLLSMSLEKPWALPDGYNDTPGKLSNEDMIAFHMDKANAQLQQAYWAIMAAAVLGRTFVMPEFSCYCTKHSFDLGWCRINGEAHTVFPYPCAVPDLFRAKKVFVKGIRIPLQGKEPLTVHVRERTFLSNPRVPEEIKASKVVLRPHGDKLAEPPKPESLKSLSVVNTDGLAVVNVPWPLNTDELRQVLDSLSGGPYRVVHLEQPERLLGRGFPDTETWLAYDRHIGNYTTNWGSRHDDVCKQTGKPKRELYEIVPPSRSPVPGLVRVNAWAPPTVP